MSIIVHPCTECGHPDYWRRGKPGQAGAGCGVTFGCHCQCTPGEPQVRPTYDIRGHVVELIIKPGDAFWKGTFTCGCPACIALYEQLTAVPA